MLAGFNDSGWSQIHNAEIHDCTTVLLRKESKIMWSRWSTVVVLSVFKGRRAPFPWRRVERAANSTLTTLLQRPWLHAINKRKCFMTSSDSLCGTVRIFAGTVIRKPICGLHRYFRDDFVRVKAANCVETSIFCLLLFNSIGCPRHNVIWTK
jgi:hypothetical protein